MPVLEPGTGAALLAGLAANFWAVQTRVAASPHCLEDHVAVWTLSSCQVGPSPAVSHSDEETKASVFILHFMLLPPSHRWSCFVAN